MLTLYRAEPDLFPNKKRLKTFAAFGTRTVWFAWLSRYPLIHSVAKVSGPKYRLGKTRFLIEE